MLPDPIFLKFRSIFMVAAGVAILSVMNHILNKEAQSEKIS